MNECKFCQDLPEGWECDVCGTKNIRCPERSGGVGKQCVLRLGHTGSHRADGRRWSLVDEEDMDICGSIYPSVGGEEQRFCVLSPGHRGFHVNGDLQWEVVGSISDRSLRPPADLDTLARRDINRGTSRENWCEMVVDAGVGMFCTRPIGHTGTCCHDPAGLESRASAPACWVEHPTIHGMQCTEHRGHNGFHRALEPAGAIVEWSNTCCHQNHPTLPIRCLLEHGHDERCAAMTPSGIVRWPRLNQMEPEIEEAPPTCRAICPGGRDGMGADISCILPIGHDGDHQSHSRIGWHNMGINCGNIEPGSPVDAPEICILPITHAGRHQSSLGATWPDFRARPPQPDRTHSTTEASRSADVSGPTGSGMGRGVLRCSNVATTDGARCRLGVGHAGDHIGIHGAHWLNEARPFATTPPNTPAEVMRDVDNELNHLAEYLASGPQPAPQCGSQNPRLSFIRCQLTPGHNGEHRRGNATWTNYEPGIRRQP